MKEILYGTFFGKPVYIKLEDTDDENWFKQKMDNYQKQEIKEREEYHDLKIKKDMGSLIK